MGAVAPVLEKLSQSIDLTFIYTDLSCEFVLLTSYECPRILKLPFEPPWCCYGACGSWRCSFDILGRGTGLETRFYQVEGVADYDACCAGYITRPEICGHGFF